MLRPLPRSLTGRLVVTAAVTIVLALALAAVSIGHVLGRFVMHDLDGRLDTQIVLLVRAVRPDGTVNPAALVDLPPFDRAGSGWAWEILAPGGSWRSASLGPAELPLPRGWRDMRPPPPPLPEPPPHPPWDGQLPPPGDLFLPPETGGAIPPPHPLDGRDATGRWLHYRITSLPTSGGPVYILAAGPRAIVERPLRGAMAPLLLSLLLLGLFLTVALIVQLRVGLRPLTRLRVMMAEVRAGRLRAITVSEPTELLPLVEEVNALIAANHQAVSRARAHVANLAHGLKTPLATLRLDLDAPGRDADGVLRVQVARMERQIRHHLGRARAAETGGAAVPASPLAPHVADLCAVLPRLYADRPVSIETDVPEALAVRCDPQDLDELLGNLLDNACRHATSRVTVTARAEGRMTLLQIADDGPGMSAAAIAAFSAGRRLDESGAASGNGFGLLISRELAELHGGEVTLAPRDPLGLEVRITLPAA